MKPPPRLLLAIDVLSFATVAAAGAGIWFFVTRQTALAAGAAALFVCLLWAGILIVTARENSAGE